MQELVSDFRINNIFESLQINVSHDHNNSRIVQHYWTHSL